MAVTVAHRMVLQHELASEGTIAVKRRRRGTSQILIAEGAYCRGRGCTVGCQQGEGGLLFSATFSLAWSRFMLAMASPVMPATGWPAAIRLARWILTGYTLAT